jgi:peptidoglycan-associated lipoprotein
MQPSKTLRTIGLCLIVGLALFTVAGCKKKTTPIARTTAPADRTPGPSVQVPAPSVELTASPTTLRRGAEATLSWRSSNAESVLIDGGVGNVGTEGSVKVTPMDSTTYTAIARGQGGEARASARITVVRDEAPAAIDQTDLQALQKAIEEGLIRPVFFAYDKADLTAEARATLEENAKWFRRYPNAQIIVEGHCDERGTEEYNLALGDRRANAARDYLIQLGVPAARMEAVSYGEERPFVQGTTEAAYAQNRRAHFVVR